MSFPFTHVHDSATISTTEYYLFSDSVTAVPQTTAARVTGWINFAAMTAAETYDINFYEKVNGGSMLKAFMTSRLIGVQAELFFLPEFPGKEGYEVSVTKIAGTDRSIGWGLDYDVGDVNVVAWNGTAPNNLTSGSVQADVKRWQGTPPDNLDGLGWVKGDVSAWNGVIVSGSAKQDLGIAREGTCQAGSTVDTIVLDAGASATDNIYNGLVVGLTASASPQGGRKILSYNGATKTAIVSPPWTVAPTNVSAYQLRYADGDTSSINQLLHANSVIDNTVHGASGTTSARLRAFATAAQATAATDGQADNAAGEISRWTVTTDYDGVGQVKTHRLTRTL